MKLEFGELILMLAIAAILLLAVFFIVCRRYEDGLVGNLALGGMAGACALILWDAWRTTLEVPSPEYCLLIASVAVFFLRHGYRFAMFHWHGRFGWSKPRENSDTAGQTP